MQEAKEKLKALEDELSDINETSHEMHQIMRLVDVPQDLLYTAKERYVTFRILYLCLTQGRQFTETQLFLCIER